MLTNAISTYWKNAYLTTVSTARSPGATTFATVFSAHHIFAHLSTRPPRLLNSVAINDGSSAFSENKSWNSVIPLFFHCARLAGRASGYVAVENFLLSCGRKLCVVSRVLRDISGVLIAEFRYPFDSELSRSMFYIEACQVVNLVLLSLSEVRSRSGDLRGTTILVKRYRLLQRGRSCYSRTPSHDSCLLRSQQGILAVSEHGNVFYTVKFYQAIDGLINLSTDA